MIHIEQVTKKYGTQTVLDKVTMDFEAGHIYGLVGTNGCGKTTLLRLICGFARPTSGSVHVQGKQVGKDVDFPQSMGILIETPEFLAHLSGLKNLLILANISGRADRARAEEVMRIVGLDPQNKKRVGAYSLGMRQRLGIAQAIMENPDILLLDEPFNGLDKNAMADIQVLFQRLKSEGKTILLISHYAQEIAANCDTVYEIHEGKLHNTANHNSRGSVS